MPGPFPIICQLLPRIAVARNLLNACRSRTLVQLLAGTNTPARRMLSVAPTCPRRNATTRPQRPLTSPFPSLLHFSTSSPTLTADDETPPPPRRAMLSSSPSTSAEADAADPASPEDQSNLPPLPSNEPATQSAFDMTFTCKQCVTRSTHRISKQGYYNGTVLVQCPGCETRHLISDHLKIFSDKKITIEDLMREKGELVRRGRIDKNGDVEFWK